MALQLPHTFRPHKVVITCRKTGDVIIFSPSLQRSYKQKPPPGKARDIGKETGHVLSQPGDFLFLDKFTSTGFIDKIYNMEVLLLQFRGQRIATQEIFETRKLSGLSTSSWGPFGPFTFSFLSSALRSRDLCP